MAIVKNFKTLFTFLVVTFLLLMGNVAYGATFSLSPSGEIDFTAHAGAMATHTVTITNQTSYPLALTLGYSGSGSGLFTTSTNYLTLAANGSQTVTLTFAPVTSGLDSAKLNVMSATGDSASDLLVGNATAQGNGSFQIVQGSGPIVFNTHAGTSTSSSIDIKNLTNSQQIVLLTTSGSTLFTANTSAVTIPANGSQSVTLTFAPALAGNDTGRLMLTGTNGDTESVQLLGNATTAASGKVSAANNVDFSTPVGQTECLPVTINNSMLGAVTVSNATITGDTDAFSTSSSGSTNIGGGNSGTITVCFHPATVTGNYNGTLNFNYASTLDSLVKGTVSVGLNGSASAASGGTTPFFVVTPSVNFNNVISGTTDCQAIQIANPAGGETVTIDSATLSGSGMGQFNVSGGNNLSVPANSTQFVNVCFTPTTTGVNQNATVNLHYSVNGTTLSGTIPVAISGNGIDTTSSELTNCIYVRHAAGVIGPIVLGGSDTSSLYLTNRSNGAVTISGATLTGSDASAFSSNANQFPMTLQSGQQGQILVNFNPTGVNGLSSYGATLNLAASGTGMTCGPIAINVEGVAVPGAGGNGLRDTSSINLGLGLTGNGTNVIAITNSNPTLNACVIDTVTFTNTTNAAITVTNIAIMQNPNITLLNPLSSATTVTPGGTLLAYLQFCGMGETGVQFNTTMYVSTTQSIQPQTYQIQAVDPPAPSSVNEQQSAAINFSIQPNPSAGEVTLDVSGAAKVKVEVYDLLGGLVTTLNGTSNLVWNGMDAIGSPVSSGAYIIRVSGTALNGQSFITSKEMIIQR